MLRWSTVYAGIPNDNLVVLWMKIAIERPKQIAKAEDQCGEVIAHSLHIAFFVDDRVALVRLHERVHCH